ncbi:MAG TPA: hypothetical protein VK184_12260 [Nostocaceae cyanobacterium]|nr:hypothetical protein [Nostocaceae cyanobacterium]
MKIAIQQEDIQLLSEVLQEQLLTEVPSGNILKVKCAVQNGQLMILTQHPQGIMVDTDRVFAVLTKALKAQSSQSQQVQLFVRKEGEKLPYAKQNVNIELPIQQEEQQDQQEAVFRGESDRLFITPNDFSPPEPAIPSPPVNSPLEPVKDSVTDNSFGSLTLDPIPDSPFASTDPDPVTDNSFESLTLDPLNIDPLTDAGFGTQDTSSNPFNTIESLTDSPFDSATIESITDTGFGTQDTIVQPFDSIDSLTDEAFEAKQTTIQSFDSIEALDSPFDSATIESVSNGAFATGETTSNPFGSVDSFTDTDLGTKETTSNPFGSVDSFTDTDLGTKETTSNPFGSVDSFSDSPMSFATENQGFSSFDAVEIDSEPNGNFGSVSTNPQSDLPFPSISLDTSSFLNSENEMEEEVFDPLAGVPNLLEEGQKKPKLPPIPIMLGMGLTVVGIFGGGGYFLAKACVISECQEITNAEQLKNTELPQEIRKAKSITDLVRLQEEIKTAIADLDGIPGWSPRHQQAQTLSTDFDAQLKNIDNVINGLRQGLAAMRNGENPANSIEELKTRQNTWRKAIASLEAIKPNNELYGLAQQNLPTYKQKLQTLNQQLISEEQWFKRLNASKAVANTAVQRQSQAKSANEWQTTQNTWQIAINSLKAIPQNSAAYSEAQTLLAEYQPKLNLSRNRATREQAATQDYQRAISAANQAKAFEQRNQWQAAVNSWKQAVDSAKKVPTDSIYYSQAQPLIEPYSTSLTQAQAQLQLVNNLTQTRIDLNKACNNNFQFCTFTLDNQRITVRLTSEYEKAIAGEGSNAGIDMQSHFQSLRSALAIISQNAGLPVFLYNAQGQELTL